MRRFHLDSEKLRALRGTIDPIRRRGPLEKVCAAFQSHAGLVCARRDDKCSVGGECFWGDFERCEIPIHVRGPKRESGWPSDDDWRKRLVGSGCRVRHERKGFPVFHYIQPNRAANARRSSGKGKQFSDFEGTDAEAVGRGGKIAPSEINSAGCKSYDLPLGAQG